MTKIKLCGLSRKEDIKAANALAPDFIGFVFAEKSKRRVTHIEAVELKAELKPEIKAVGEFTISVSALPYVRSVLIIDAYSRKQRSLKYIF